MPRATTVDQTQFAKLVGITPRHVRRLTDDGVLQKARDEDGKELRGRYELAFNILAYCNYLRSKARLDDSGSQRYDQLRNEKMAADNRISQHKLHLLEGKLHRADDVEFSWTNILTAVKQRLLSIPSRVARQLKGQTSFRVIYDIIMAEIELALRELSTYKPNMFDAQSEAFLADEEAKASKNGETDAEV
jgi:phage terminase Nu1 subunit (DNA packaging protein)